MATLMIVTYRISSNGGGGFLPHQQTEHLISSAVELHKLQGQMASM